MNNRRTYTYLFLGRTTSLGLLFLCLSFSTVDVWAQKEIGKEQVEAQELLSEASLELKNENFPISEANYRKAIALHPKDATGKYNLGNAYYDKELNTTAMARYKQAAAVADNKPEKHKAFHNLGNTFMNEKKYQEAVDAYKNALRNNPTDDETRYNLALAKKMLEEEQKNGGGDGDDKNKDNEDENKENQENKEKQDQENKEDQKEGDKGDEKEDKDKGKEKDDKKEGDEEKDQGKPDEPKEEKKEQQQPVPGKLSPQQIKSLLEAMNNEEKKIQEKINAKKEKGAKVKSTKDW